MAITQEDILLAQEHMTFRFRRIRELLNTPEQENIKYELAAAEEVIRTLQQLAGYSQENGPVPFRITVRDVDNL